jgi:hypothetical protein
MKTYTVNQVLIQAAHPEYGTFTVTEIIEAPSAMFPHGLYTLRCRAGIVAEHGDSIDRFYCAS